MSISVPLSDLSEEKKKEILKELTLSSKPNFFDGKVNDLYPYEVEDDQVYLPFYYGNQKIGRYPNDALIFPKAPIKFTGQLREYQREVTIDAIKRLNAVRCVFLTLATGKGKTATSIYLAAKLGLKAAVMIHRTEIFKGWKKSLAMLVPGTKVQHLTSVNKIDLTADVYLIGPLAAAKRKRGDFVHIGFLIVDEADAMCTDKMSKGFLHFSPKYCIGLSATPDRTDELDQVLDLHFGLYHINVPLWVEHNYFKFETSIVPVTKKNVQGNTDWNSLLEYQGNHEERNALIVRVCQFFPDRYILVLCKRSDQTMKLHQLLQDEKESVDYTTGPKKNFRDGTRILISTYSKSGVGFDYDVLDMLIVAADVQERFDQYFGRCVRREDTVPIVVDFVDKLKSLDRHFATRKAYAKSVGGTIINFHKHHPEF